MQLFNPALAKLRDRVRLNTTIEPDPLPLLTTSIFEEYLLEIGAIAIKMTAYGEELHVLEFGTIGSILWWIEFYLNDEVENELVVSLVSMPLPIEAEDKPDYLEFIASRNKGQKGCRLHLVDTVEVLGQIDSILDRAFRFAERVNCKYEVAIQSTDRLNNYLTGIGHCVMWPTEIAYDLERLTVLSGDTERRYYVDSIENIATAAGGIYFKDILGRGIVISHGSGYIVESLTFRNITELAAENSSLVVSRVELLMKFDRVRIDGFAEPFVVYNPDSKAAIAHQFLVPVASIAENLKPVLEVGGI